MWMTKSCMWVTVFFPLWKHTNFNVRPWHFSCASVFFATTFARFYQCISENFSIEQASHWFKRIFMLQVFFFQNIEFASTLHMQYVKLSNQTCWMHSLASAQLLRFFVGKYNVSFDIIRFMLSVRRFTGTEFYRRVRIRKERNENCMHLILSSQHSWAVFHPLFPFTTLNDRIAFTNTISEDFVLVSLFFFWCVLPGILFFWGKNSGNPVYLNGITSSCLFTRSTTMIQNSSKSFLCNEGIPNVPVRVFCLCVCVWLVVWVHSTYLFILLRKEIWWKDLIQHIFSQFSPKWAWCTQFFCFAFHKTCNHVYQAFSISLKWFLSLERLNEEKKTAVFSHFVCVCAWLSCHCFPFHFH